MNKTKGCLIANFATVPKKVLLATDKAHALIAVLPPAIKSPGMTAAWEQELEKVASGSGNMSVFMKQIS
ncbi:hypothetical protein ACQHME_23730, partial [Escherichia coli]|uniref:hypothetical protein n=1 Tax=Escherichia coli TaxID=562 RepID=UPI003CFB5CF5